MEENNKLGEHIFFSFAFESAGLRGSTWKSGGRVLSVRIKIRLCNSFLEKQLFSLRIPLFFLVFAENSFSIHISGSDFFTDLIFSYLFFSEMQILFLYLINFFSKRVIFSLPRVCIAPACLRVCFRESRFFRHFFCIFLSLFPAREVLDFSGTERRDGDEKMQRVVGVFRLYLIFQMRGSGFPFFSLYVCK